MKEFVSFDVVHYKLDCTDATQHCNDRKPCNYAQVKELQWEVKFGALGFSFGFEVC